jgi:serine/threonine-protein kinase RsbW
MIAGTADPALTVPIAWSRAFLATPAQAREARQFLSRILADFPAADDAVLCLAELASNAIVHSLSRKPGGHFTVRAQMRRGDRLRVEVEDQGGTWTRHLIAPDAPHGRGLAIVARLARDWGRTGDGQTGWTVWFELDCPLPAASAMRNSHEMVVLGATSCSGRCDGPG